MRFQCGIHGLVLESAVDLPLPRARHPRPDVVYRIRLSDTLRPPKQSRVDDPDDPWAIEHWLQDGMAVEFPGRAVFEFDRRTITLVRDETGDDDHLDHLLIDHVVPRVVGLRGDLMLHASAAVGPSGQAHLFLGAPGAGKSTLVTLLAQNGWSLLDDDAVRVAWSDGRFRVFPGAGNVRLLPDAAAELLPDVAPGARIGSGSAKRRYSAQKASLRVAAAPAQIATLYVLGGEEACTPSLERLSLGESVGVLARHGFHLAEDPNAVTRRTFEKVTALATVAPIHHLSGPSGREGLDARVVLLTAIDGDELS